MRWVWAAIAAVIVLAGAGCSDRLSTDEIAQWVKTDLQGFVHQDKRLKPYGPQILSVHLVRETDTTYTGYAEVSPLRGPDGRVPLEVTYDDEGHAMWKTPPGAWLWMMFDQDVSSGQ
ncbi:hypothetical protein [Mycolicibacterium sp. XJ1819]